MTKKLKPGRLPTFVLYRPTVWGWRWLFRLPSGRDIADSSKGHKTWQTAMKDWETVRGDNSNVYRGYHGIEILYNVVVSLSPTKERQKIEAKLIKRGYSI